MLTAPFLGNGTARSGAGTFSTAGSSTSRTQRLLNTPPHPLGEDVEAFPYGASTGLLDDDDDDGERGRQARLNVKVEPPEGSGSYKSGEAVRGVVTLEAGEVTSLPPGAAAFLQVRLYYESRTLFWRARLEQNGKARFYTSPEATFSLGHEWHRAIADDAVLHSPHPDDDDPVLSCLAEPGSSRRWPFSLHIPSTLSPTERNDLGERPAYHPGLDILRPPPPTLRDNPNASVEWVVEAVLRVVSDPAEDHAAEETDRLPAFGDPDDAGSALVDDRGFALSVPPHLLVGRATLPVVPADGDCPPLELYPSFGQSPSKRTETGGAELVDVPHQPLEEEDDDLTLSQVPTAPTELERVVTARGGTRQVWRKRVPFETKLGLSRGAVESQVAVPPSLVISRRADTFRIQIKLAFIPPSRPLLGKRSSSSGRDGGEARVALDAVSVRLAARTLTRGGREGRPFLMLREVQKHDFASAEIRRGVGEEGAWWDLDLDLQNVGRPCRDLVPSFRTPNIEREYVCTVNVLPSNEHLFCAARFPIQLRSGDRPAEPPPFLD